MILELVETRRSALIDLCLQQFLQQKIPINKKFRFLLKENSSSSTGKIFSSIDNTKVTTAVCFADSTSYNWHIGVPLPQRFGVSLQIESLGNGQKVRDAEIRNKREKECVR